MSTANKARDRNTNGRLKHKYTGKCCAWRYDNTPKWWVKLTMTRPKRRTITRACALLQQGKSDPDGTAFPLGNRKPHNYFH